MLLLERTYTADDLWALSHAPAYRDLRLELSEGRLLVMSPASYKHGKHISTLDRSIGNFVAEHDLGEVTGAETGFILYKNPDADGKDIVRAPDVGFVSRAMLARVPAPETGFYPAAPDLAVEVVSPNDDADDLHTKTRQYLRHGTKMVIAVYASTRSVVVHTPEGAATLEEADTLDGGAVLPGWRLRVGDIFR
jgi:Uma2 family endonuclease